MSPSDNLEHYRILHTAAGLHFGGVGRSLLTNLRNIDRDRFSSHVCYFLPKHDLEIELRRAGIDVRYLPLQRASAGISAVLQLARLINNLRIDLVHTNHEIDHVLAAVAAAKSGTPVIRSLHHLGGPGTGVAKTSPVSARAWARFRRFAVGCINRQLTDHFVAVSQATKETHARYDQLNDADITVIYPGVPQPKLPFGDEAKRWSIVSELGIEGAGPILVNVGRLHPVKDQRQLIPMMKEIIDHWPSARLLIVGGGELERDLAREVQQWELAEHVRLLGQRDDVESILACGDVFISSSLKEGFGISVVEGMLAGKPIVGVRNPSIDEIIDDGVTGYLVPPGNSHALARAVLKLLAAPTTMRKMGEAARSSADARFGVSKSIRSLEQLYERVLESA